MSDMIGKPSTDESSRLMLRLADADRRNEDLIELLRDINRYGTSAISIGGTSILCRISTAINADQAGENK